MKVNHKYLEEAKKELNNKFSKKQLIEKYYEIAEKCEGKWKDKVMLSISPKSEDETLQYGNALANSGNYPVGLNGCFCVGISGGCGVNCYVLNNGECENFEEVAIDHEMSQAQIDTLHNKGFYNGGKE